MANMVYDNDDDLIIGALAILFDDEIKNEDDEDEKCTRVKGRHGDEVGVTIKCW